MKVEVFSVTWDERVLIDEQLLVNIRSNEDASRRDMVAQAIGTVLGNETAELWRSCVTEELRSHSSDRPAEQRTRVEMRVVGTIRHVNGAPTRFHVERVDEEWPPHIG